MIWSRKQDSEHHKEKGSDYVQIIAKRKRKILKRKPQLETIKNDLKTCNLTKNGTDWRNRIQVGKFT